MHELANWIDGVPAAPLRGGSIPRENPATGQPTWAVPDSGPEDVERAVRAAAAAFPAWSGRSANERAAMLRAVADGIEARLDDFAAAESASQGKLLRQARDIEIPRAVWNFRYFASAIEHSGERAFSSPGMLNYTLRRPLGVAGLIVPWNLPLYLLTWKIAPALAAGNTAVCKPSELTPVTASMLGPVMAEAGLPNGVCNVVHGLGPKVGEALCVHPEVPLISFTGGTATGERIQRSTAPFCKKLSLELGGKNANIIFADADFDACLDTSLRSSFLNQGEVCLCGSRIFVERPLYERFLAAFVARTKALVVGDPKLPASGMGPLISAAHLEKVLGYIALAREEGGTVECGGERLHLPGELAGGHFLAPTVLTGLAPGCRVQQEEIFGPVVSVTPFDTVDEAVSWANGTPYGLSASLWTRDLTRAHTVAARLDVGTVWVNTWLARDLRVPFGGMKASGVGREGGEDSLAFYSEEVNVCIKL